MPYMCTTVGFINLLLLYCPYQAPPLSLSLPSVHNCLLADVVCGQHYYVGGEIKIARHSSPARLFPLSETVQTHF